MLLDRRLVGILMLVFLGMCLLQMRRRAGPVTPSRRPIDLERLKAEDPFFYEVALKKEFDSGVGERITKWAPGRTISYVVQGEGGQFVSLDQFRGYVHEILGRLASLTGLTYVDVTGRGRGDVTISFVDRVSKSNSGGIVSESANQIAGLALASLGSDGYLESGTVQVVNSLSPEGTYTVLLEEATQLLASLFFDVSDPAYRNSIFFKHKQNISSCGWTPEDVRIIRRLYSGEFD